MTCMKPLSNSPTRRPLTHETHNAGLDVYAPLASAGSQRDIRLRSDRITLQIKMARCKQCGSGLAKYSGATYCSEDCAQEAHDSEHPNPINYWGECGMCKDFIECEIETGERNVDGSEKEDAT